MTPLPFQHTHHEPVHHEPVHPTTWTAMQTKLLSLNDFNQALFRRCLQKFIKLEAERTVRLAIGAAVRSATCEFLPAELSAPDFAFL